MAMELKQHMKLSQQLVMTPQLQQAIKLLQLSRMELLEQVREEMEQNPLLEQPDETVEPNMDEKADESGPAEIDWEAYLNSYQFNEQTTASNKGNVATDDLPSFEANLVRKEDLTEHLYEQFHVLKLNDAERRVGALIIGNLDD